MAQKGSKFPTPVDPALDGKRGATGSGYPDPFFVNPWNAMLDEQYGDEDGQPNSSRTLYGPTHTPVAMNSIPLHGKSSYDSNWEHGVRGGIEAKPKGPRSGTRWTPKGGKD